jgi:hypothetical protein
MNGTVVRLIVTSDVVEGAADLTAAITIGVTTLIIRTAGATKGIITTLIIIVIGSATPRVIVTLLVAAQDVVVGVAATLIIGAGIVIVRIELVSSIAYGIGEITSGIGTAQGIVLVEPVASIVQCIVGIGGNTTQGIVLIEVGSNIAQRVVLTAQGVVVVLTAQGIVLIKVVGTTAAQRVVLIKVVGTTTAQGVVVVVASAEGIVNGKCGRRQASNRNCRSGSRNELTASGRQLRSSSNWSLGDKGSGVAFFKAKIHKTTKV